MDNSRRRFLHSAMLLLAATPLRKLLASPTGTTAPGHQGNFHYVYSRDALRREFLDFYKNVFHLYPPEALHELITQISRRHDGDEEVYRELQSRLDEVSPFLASLRYAVPALSKQKQEMTRQTLQLLDRDRVYQGYLEVGTTGRYISQLEEHLNISDERFLLHKREAGYGPEDIIERGQLSPIGQYVPMGNYDTEFLNTIGSNSLDLVTVYIGFHHCPVAQRQAFIGAICDVLKPGGKLILRDHDAHDETMIHIAALAHDTFNAGTRASWQHNQDELRNFYSNQFIIDYLQAMGMKFGNRILFQQGDPTRNGLMVFTKV